MNDNIRIYITPATAGVTMHCPACDRLRAIWVGETEDGETLTCCGHCQRVIRRQKIARIRIETV